MTAVSGLVRWCVGGENTPTLEPTIQLTAVLPPTLEPTNPLTAVHAADGVASIIQEALRCVIHRIKVARPMPIAAMTTRMA